MGWTLIRRKESKGNMTMDMQEKSSHLERIEKIADQPWRTTWKVKIDGEFRIAKIIDCKIVDKCKRLESVLDKQLKLSQNIKSEDGSSICLFNRKIVEGNEIIFLRPYIEGRTLDDIIKKNSYSFKQKLELFLKIAKVVQNAHETYHVAHGDLKPANIIISNESQNIVVIDWDTMSMNVSIMNGDKTKTLDEGWGGTPKYMPYEQCTGHSADEQCDVYALGIILYQIINNGKTPFDEPPYSGKNNAQLMGEKQKDLDPCFDKLSKFGVSLGLSRVIDLSISNERDKRYSSVSQFINELLVNLPENDEAIPTPGPILAPQPIQNPPNQPLLWLDKIKSFIQKLSNQWTGKKNGYKLVLIGHPQSGKTSLATGLYATNQEEFTVAAHDENTKIFMISTKTNMENHQWPQKTGLGSIFDLNFKISSQGKDALISFAEYPGELMKKPTFFEDVLKQPDGVLILLNAGAPQLRDSLERNKMLADFDKCIMYLCNLPNHPAIAFVVTASDRLKSDLKGWADQFEEYATFIKNKLGNNKCQSERFDVSVCKSLKKQDEPELSPKNNIYEPFKWLLEVFEKRRKKNIYYKIGVVAASLLLIILMAVGLLCISDKCDINEIEKTVEDARENMVVYKKYQDAIDKYNEAQTKFYEWKPLWMHKQKDNKILGTLAYRFNCDYLPQKEQCEFEMKCKDLRDYKIKSEQSLIMLKKIHEIFDIWKQRESVSSQKIRNDYDEKIKKIYQDTIQWEYEKVAEKIMQEIRECKDNELNKLLNNYKKFLEMKQELNLHQDIPEKIILKNESELYNIVIKRLEQYIDSLCKTFNSETQKKSDKLEAPGFKEDLENKIFPYIDITMANNLRNRVNDKIEQIHIEWTVGEKQKVVDFIERNKNINKIETVLMEFCKFIQTELHNKNLIDAENFILDRIYEELNTYCEKIKKRDIENDFFIKMNKLKILICKQCQDSKTISNHEIYKWIQNFDEWREKTRSLTVKINAIEAKVENNYDKPYIGVIRFKDKNSDVKLYSSNGWNTTRFNKNYKKFDDEVIKWPLSSSYSLGDKLNILLGVYEQKNDPKTHADRKIDELICIIYPGIDEIDSNGYIYFNSYKENALARVSVDISGESFYMWIKNHPFPSR